MQKNTLIKKILVVLPNYIGDVLMSTPALHLLRKISPELNITVLTASAGKEILEICPDINQIITRPLKLTLKDRIKLIKDIKELKPDCVLLFRTTFFNSLMAYLSKAKIRAGIMTEFSEIFLNRFVKKDKKRRFRDEYLEILFSVFPEQKDKISDEEIYKMRIYTNENDKKYIDGILKEHKLEKKFAIIIASTTRPSKNWALKNYAFVIDELQERFNIKTVLIGSKNDFERNEKIIGLTKHKPINLAGKTNLRQLAELIKRASIFIGPDTGATYISSSVDTNTIALFGSTDPAKFGPFEKDNNIVIYKKLPCSPCYKNICPKIKKNEVSLCMSLIMPEEVLAKLELFKNFYSWS